MKFVVSEYLTDFTTVPWLHFQAFHLTKPQRKRIDGVGPGRLGSISSTWERRTASGFPIDVGWGIKIRNTHVQYAIGLLFQEIADY